MSGGAGSARLVLVLVAGEERRPLLEAAVRLAGRLEREVLGLFVEDRDLMAASALQILRVVSAGGAAESVLDPASARRASRVMASRARGELAEAAGHRVRWSFEIREAGSPDSGLRPGDVLALGVRGWRHLDAAGARPEALACPMVLLGNDGGPVLVVFGGDDETLALGARLAAAEGVPVEVVAAACGLAEADRLAAQTVLRMPPGVAVEPVDETLPGALARSVCRHRPGIVVVDGRGGPGRWRGIAAALAAAPRQLSGR